MAKRIRLVFLEPAHYITMLKTRELYNGIYDICVNIPVCYHCKRYLLYQVCYIVNTRVSKYVCLHCAIRYWGYQRVINDIKIKMQSLKEHEYRDIYYATYMKIKKK